MNTDLDSIVAQIPGWAHAPDLTVEPLSGLTNTNYLVRVNEKRFVLRVSGPNTALLGIDRKAELAALKAEIDRINMSTVGHWEELKLPVGLIKLRFLRSLWYWLTRR